MVKSRLKKVPQSARLSAGGGVIAIWAMPKQRWGQAERGFPYRDLTCLRFLILQRSGTSNFMEIQKSYICKKSKKVVQKQAWQEFILLYILWHQTSLKGLENFFMDIEWG